MKEKICCVFNVAAHYRESIYKLIDENIDCDFYIGDRVGTKLKLMDYSLLKGYKKTLKYKRIFRSFHVFLGETRLIFRPYRIYVISGDIFCLSNWFLLFLAKICGKKIVGWSHGWYGKEGRLTACIKRVFYGLMDRVLLYGDYARNLMIKEGFSEGKLVCIYNSLSYDRQLKIRREVKETNAYKNHFKNDYPVIIYIGRLQKIKRLDVLLDAFDLLNNEGFALNLMIIGDAVDNCDFTETIRNSRYQDRIWLYGACYDETLNGEFLYSADLCVSPGNVGLTAIHAMMFGCPVITNNNFAYQMPEFEAIVPNETGLFFEQENVADLSIKIKEWLLFSGQHRQIIRENCFKVIDNKYNPNCQIEILKSVIESL